MPSPRRTTFLDLVSGRRTEWWASACRSGLRLAEFPYTWAVNVRNRRFERGQTPVHRVDVPVISVGNITAGGTGKTPFVAWLARWLKRRGLRVVLISRGYHAHPGHPNDEALELQRALPEVPHLQNANRVAAARQALAELRAEVLVLDDAFQHRHLHRDLDIVLIDALEPFGFGHVLPRGLLREPLTGLARAQVIGLSRADAVEPAARALIRDEVRRWAPEAAWIELAHQPQRLINHQSAEQAVSNLRGQRVAAFCGIGNPTAFHRSLTALGATVVGFEAFPDHYRYAAPDLARLAAWVQSLGPLAAVLCTGKDLVKISATELGSVPLWALEIAMDVTSGLELLETQLRKLVK